MKILKTDEFSEKLKIRPVDVNKLTLNCDDLFNIKKLSTGMVVEFEDGSFGMFIKNKDKKRLTELKGWNEIKGWPDIDLFLCYGDDDIVSRSEVLYTRIDMYDDNLINKPNVELSVVSIFRDKINKSVYELEGFIKNFYNIIIKFTKLHPKKTERKI